MLNALSIDVEEYFQVSAFARVVDPEHWSGLESRVLRNTMTILDILGERDLKATFFFLGWVAEHCPELVRRVHAGGHEIATHGYGHQLITRQTPETFQADVKRSLVILEDLVGERVMGYRAPSYSITPQTAWALDVLRELGLDYDSSLFPITHDLGGFPACPRHPFPLHDGFWEFPLTTWRIWRWNLPIAGGGYLRLYPYSFTKWAINRVNAENAPAMTYVHPWEFDPGQPRIQGAPLLSRFRHYQNLNKTRGRLQSLCADFRFAPIRTVLEGWKAGHIGDGSDGHG